jgi:hypothetical protein
MADKIRRSGSQRREDAAPTGREKSAVETGGGRASAGNPAAEGIHRKKQVRHKAERTAALLLVARFGLIRWRVCRLAALDRDMLRYQSGRSDGQGLRARMREIAGTKGRD